MIDGRPLSLPPRLVPSGPGGHGAEPLNLVVSADERPLLGRRRGGGEHGGGAEHGGGDALHGARSAGSPASRYFLS